MQLVSRLAELLHSAPRVKSQARRVIYSAAQGEGHAPVICERAIPRHHALCCRHAHRRAIAAAVAGQPGRLAALMRMRAMKWRWNVEGWVEMPMV